MKKLWMILPVVMLVFGLVVGCEEEKDKGPANVTCSYCGDTYKENAAAAHYADCFCRVCVEDWEACECLYIARQFTLIQDGAGGLPTVGEDMEAGSTIELEQATGKGYFTGKQFAWLKNAKRGDKILVRMYGGASGTGTTNSIGWANCGAVGIVHLEGNEDKRVDLTFGANGLLPNPTAVVEETAPLLFYVAIEDLWRVNTFETATFAYINAWASGSFFIKDAFYCMPKTPVDDTPVTPTARDFYIDATLLQFLDEGDVIPVTIKPRYNMSKGAITIKYGDATTVPTTPGNTVVTFDVAAATGFNAASGLPAGTLDIRASKPQAGTLGSFLLIGGFPEIQGLDLSQVIVANTNPGSPFKFNAGGTKPEWVLNDDNTYSIKVSGTGWHGLEIDLSVIPIAVGDVITVKGRMGAVGGAVLVNCGDWNPIVAQWGLAAGGAFNISGPVDQSHLTDATAKQLRIEANGVAEGNFFFIDGIEIAR